MDDTVSVTVDPDGVLRWTRQFGTSGSDAAYGVAVDATGRVAVVGNTAGDLEGPGAGDNDAYVRSYDADGLVRWTRQFGTSSADLAYGVAIDGGGRVYVVGSTFGVLDGASAGSLDAFLRAYDADGGLRWTRQFGTSTADFASGVAVDADGRVYVAGYTLGDLEGVSFGDRDAFVRAYDAEGALRWTRQFGTLEVDSGVAVAVDAAGRVYVAGYTFGDLEGVSFGDRDAFVRSYDAAGDLRWTRQFGSSADDDVNGVDVDGAGRITVVGSTEGDLEGANAGADDAFVRSYDTDGALRWTRQFGTSASDLAADVSVNAGGVVSVVGRTAGALEGASAGGSDAFIRSYDVDGAVRWARQFGTGSDDGLLGVAVDADGRAAVGGYTDGALTGASAGGQDALLRSFGP
jgi:hypothetical protein